jgi:hypothetical protein
MISSRLCSQSLRQEHDGWPIDAKRANGQSAILFVDPKTQMSSMVDFST